MKVYKSFAENMWPYFNSFLPEKVELNMENIWGKIYFHMMNLKCVWRQTTADFAGNNQGRAAGEVQRAEFAVL